MSISLTKAAKSSFLALTILVGIHAKAQAEACPSLLRIKTLTANHAIEANKQIRIRIALASNKIRFWAIDTLVNTSESGLAVGQSLEVPDAQVCVNTQQLDQLIRFFPMANLGLNVLVEQKISATNRFFNSAKYLFLYPSAGSGIMLHTENFGTSTLKNGNSLFDPRIMLDLNLRLFHIENQNLKLTFEIDQQKN